MSRVGQLGWNTPIVDSQGRPTPEFFQKWNTQAAINGGIPSLDTPAEVSAVLDVLGAVPDSLLVRGSSRWGALTGPNDATKFLSGAHPPAWARVKDTDLSTSDVTGNDVSITKHGFAPKAPNDATQFLDGTGAYSTPGGGGSSLYATPGLLQADDGPGNASLGLMTKPMLAATVDTLGFVLGAMTGATLYAGIYEVANQFSGTITAVRATSAPVTATTGATTYLEFPLTSAFVFVPSACYILAITRTDGTSTTSAHVFWSTGFMSTSFPDAIASGGRDCRLSSVAPGVGDTFGVLSNARMACFRWS